jgi:hypothetical protein
LSLRCSADVPLYDVLKIFRFGRKHMACLTRVAPADASTGGVRRMSPTPGQGGLAAGSEGELVEEVVGVVSSGACACMFGQLVMHVRQPVGR